MKKDESFWDKNLIRKQILNIYLSQDHTSKWKKSEDSAAPEVKHTISNYALLLKGKNYL